MTCASDCITLASESAAMHPPRISGLGNLYLWCKRQEAGTSTAGEYSNPGANSLISTVFGEEEQPGDGCEHALELVDRAAVAAAFPAEHPPCLHFATACSTAARILLKIALNSRCQSRSSAPLRRLNGTIPMPSTPM